MLRAILILIGLALAVAVGVNLSRNPTNKSYTSIQMRGNRYVIESNDCVISYSPEKIRVTCFINPKPSTKPDSVRPQRVPGTPIGY